MYFYRTVGCSCDKYKVKDSVFMTLAWEAECDLTSMASVLQVHPHAAEKCYSAASNIAHTLHKELQSSHSRSRLWVCINQGVCSIFIPNVPV